jgi:hypothetical protein
MFQVTYKDRKSSDFSTAILKSKRTWKDVFAALKENNYQPGFLYPAKLSFITEGEMEVFP